LPATSETVDTLRLATAGSVDDGKSTLIGRLLYDAKSILADQLEHIAQVSHARNGNGHLDLALLTDGLRAEREQGITIDVAHRYFATPRRRFILADTPGHEQYTRNMVTGASTAEVAIVLVDARHGVVEQTRRHAAVTALLGVRHVVLAVNKMDLVDWSEEVFDRIVADFDCFAAKVGLRAVTPLPMSALHGDNVVEPSDRLGWYAGPPLLEHLETVELPAGEPGELRFPVQLVLRGEERAYAGRVAGGELRPGAELVALPSGERARVVAVETFDGPLEAAAAGQSVSVRIDRELDLARGDLLAAAESAPTVTRAFDADVCWLSERPLGAGQRLALKHGTTTVRAVIDEIVDRLDLAEGVRVAGGGEAVAGGAQVAGGGRAAGGLALNDIGRVRLRVSRPLPVEPYAANRVTGAFILVDEGTNDTVGAGMVG
jgi:sulfate adenylyltransferase subunit 1